MGEIAFAFISGLLGSGHCIGMCGPFALTLGTHAKNWRANAVRQLLFSSGRIFTYACGGITAGFLGSRLRSQFPTWLSIQVFLSAFAGVVLITQGIRILCPTWSFGRRSHRSLVCPAANHFHQFLTAPGKSEVFLAGVFTGFLPCALVYANIAIAANSADPIRGALLMAAMGLGTAPLMMMTGIGSSALGVAARQRLIRCAACLIIATGALSMLRASAYWSHQMTSESGQCPMCFPTPK